MADYAENVLWESLADHLGGHPGLKLYAKLETECNGADLYVAYATLGARGNYKL